MSEAIAARIAGAELRLLEAAHIGVAEQPQASPRRCAGSSPELRRLNAGLSVAD